MVKMTGEIFEWTKAIVIAIFLAALIRFFLFSPIVVDGESMEPTLFEGDRLIVNKIDYTISEPERFDIIVFHATEEKDYIKRIIGLPGDRIEYKDDTLLVNGVAYEEPYLDKYKQELNGELLTGSFTLEETSVRSETVPEGHYFVMGDNRRYSTDSRHIGAIPINKILGTTDVVFWSKEKNIGFVD